MSTVAPDVHPVTAGALGAVEMGKTFLLNTFKYVPDEKLNWAPAPTSRSPLRIVAHCAVSNYGLAGVLRGEEITASNFKELEALMSPEEEKITTREQAVQAIEDSANVAKQAIAAVDPSTFETMIGKGDLTGPTLFFMNLIGMHMQMHAAQVDYLETCWGDRESHFGG